eukprot:1195833-Prorocentrum_minimum.AAC.3
MEFHRICQEFRPYHKNALNVALHLVTTPAGIVSALSLIAHAAKEFKLPELPQICPYFTLEVQQVAVAFYCWTLFINMPVRLWIVNTMCMALCSYATTVLNLDLYVSLGLMVAAYVGQDVSHWITGESTYQSSYMKNSSWMSMLLQHTYYLMPCVLDAIPHMDTTFLYWLVASNNVVFSRVNQPEGRSRLAFMRQWVLDQKPSKDHTTHWWFATLPEDAKQCFSDIATSNTMMDMFHSKYPSNLWACDVIEGMNEIYVASEKHSNNSDTVFYMRHVDGPWYLFPFCGAYRCIMAVNKNERICTAFPKIPVAHTLSDGDVVGFDFNREIHYIENNADMVNKEPRITLKLHYVIYPKCLKPLGKLLAALTTAYDIAARNLFLATIKPPGLFWQGMAYIILIVTKLMFLAENVIGYNNMLYVAIAAMASKYVHPYAFLVMTSYMHYSMYIATYAQKTNVAFGLFKRNVVFYKTLALLQLAYYYLTNFQYDPTSLAMIAVGYGISTSAAIALGVDRTYFGVELGKAPFADTLVFIIEIPLPYQSCCVSRVRTL